MIIRKLLQQLKAAGLIKVSRGTGGVTITRPLDQITFLDIYKAVECTPDEELFHFHENPNSNCPGRKKYSPCVGWQIIAGAEGDGGQNLRE